MGLFNKKKTETPLTALFPPEEYEPVLRSIICTGEKTACLRHRETGKIHEIMLIRDPDDLARFARDYGIDAGSMKTIY